MRRLALILVALVLGASGCGGGEEAAPTAETVEGPLPTETGGAGAEEGDPQAGRGLFAKNGCGACHVFGPAGSSGTVGPNLDESDADFDEAYEQIEKGGSGMPAFGDKLEAKQIADLAAFVTQDGG